MKREIKFRAWDKKDKFMVDVASINFWPNGVLSVLEDFDDAEPQFADSYELMQFTGLHDKNGREIYEGDLVLLTNGYEGTIYEVIFDEAKFEISGDGGCYDLGEEFMNCEVIGNVHTNPELF